MGASDRTSESELSSTGTEKGYSTPFEPAPFEIDVSGTINDERVEVTGTGVVPDVGVYNASLNFSNIPQGFHPSVVAIAKVSICCYNAAAMRNDGLNVAEMGTTGYSVERTVSLPDEQSGEIDIEGEVFYDGSGFGFKGEVEGEVEMPDGVGGNSMYFQRIVPSENGNVLSGTASGSIFNRNGKEVRLRLDEQHELMESPSNPLTDPEFRVVTESGTLEGRTYRTVVHSIVDSENTMQKLVEEST